VKLHRNNCSLKQEISGKERLLVIKMFDLVLLNPEIICSTAFQP